MKKTLDSSVVRAALGVAILALGIGSARVVVSSADADEGSAAPIEASATTTADIPANVGSMAGLLAGNEIVATEPTRPSAVELTTSELLAAERAATRSAVSGETTTSLGSTTTAPESTTTMVDSPTSDASEPTTTTEPEPEPTTTTTSAPPVTTTTVVEETTTTTAAVGPYSGVLTEDQARELFSMYFSGSDLDTAMRIAACESSYNTDAYNPAGYGGLFQHSIVDWPDRAADAGWAGASIYDGEANTAVTAWLVAAVGGWSPWPNC